MKIFFKDALECQVFYQEFSKLAPHLSLWQMSCTEMYWRDFYALFIVTLK